MCRGMCHWPRSYLLGIGFSVSENRGQSSKSCGRMGHERANSQCCISALQCDHEAGPDEVKKKHTHTHIRKKKFVLLQDRNWDVFTCDTCILLHVTRQC